MSVPHRLDALFASRYQPRFSEKISQIFSASDGGLDEQALSNNAIMNKQGVLATVLLQQPQ